MRQLAGKLLVAVRRSWLLSAALSLVPLLAILGSIAQRHGPPEVHAWRGVGAILGLAIIIGWGGVTTGLQSLYRPRRNRNLTLLQNLQDEHRLDYAPVDGALGLDPIVPENPEPWPAERRLIGVIGRPVPDPLARVESVLALVIFALVLAGALGLDLAGRADSLLLAVGAVPAGLSNWTLLLALWTLAVLMTFRGLARRKWIALGDAWPPAPAGRDGPRAAAPAAEPPGAAPLRSHRRGLRPHGHR